MLLVLIIQIPMVAEIQSFIQKFVLFVRDLKPDKILLYYTVVCISAEIVKY